MSGGEPTLQKDLVSLCERIKGLGYLIKLDTNGSRPKVLKRLFDDGLIDYVAMDIKTDPFQYGSMISGKCHPEWILSSISNIMESSLVYEFRTTCVKPIINERVIEEIARSIKGGRRYVLQRFYGHKVLNPAYFEKQGSPFKEYELFNLKSVAGPWVKQCIIR
jgi:pyruvate formate lyase activating enzyme